MKNKAPQQGAAKPDTEIIKPVDVFGYIISEEISFQTRGVPIMDGLEWSMYDHIKKTTFYKNSKYTEGADDGSRPYQNIIVPIAKLAYRSEGFDVKDIQLYVDNPDKYYLSTLTQRYHQDWALEHSMDELIDSIVVTGFDYGGCLVKKTKETIERIHWQNVAFCDQTQVEGNPICLKTAMTMNEIQGMRGIWIDDAIDLVIKNAEQSKDNDASKVKAKTPGKNAMVYDLIGMFPETWQEDPAKQDPNKYVLQKFIVSCEGVGKDRKGVILFKSDKVKDPYKMFKRGGASQEIFGRALNTGGIEELFEPQIWTNYSIIQLKEMLDVASLIIMESTDDAYATQNNLKDMPHGQINKIIDGGNAKQVQMNIPNETAFYNSINAWGALARATGSASESSLAVTPTAGTPFALEQLKTDNGLQEHDYQRNKIADFVWNIYDDWVMPILSKDMLQGKEWLDELSMEELEATVDAVVNNAYNSKIKKMMIEDGKMMNPVEIDDFKKLQKDMHMNQPSKFITLLNNELKGIPTAVKINVAGRQKDLSKMTDKLTNVFRQIIANPAALQDPNARKIFNEILQYSGLKPMTFQDLPTLPAPAGASVPTNAAPEIPVATA